MLDKGLSRQYINQLIDCIRRMFKWATAEQLIPSTVYQSLTAVSGLRRGRSEARETTPVLPIEDIVVNATLEHMPEVPADMVRLQLLTNMRPAEVCLLRPMDLERSSDVWIYRHASHKTEHHGRERVVFIGPQAQAVLLRYLARDASMRCFRPIDSEQKRRSEQHARRKTPLSCRNVPGSNRKAKPKRKLGEFYDVASYRRTIHRACDLAFPHPDLSEIKAAELTAEQQADLRKWHRGTIVDHSARRRRTGHSPRRRRRTSGDE